MKERVPNSQCMILLISLPGTEFEPTASHMGRAKWVDLAILVWPEHGLTCWLMGCANPKPIMSVLA
jgi:hypothetical protein